MRAAKSWGKPPAAFILHEDRAEWDDWDFILAAGLQVLESETCPQCGNPKWACHSSDPDIMFDLTDETCEVTKARLRKERRDAEGKDEGAMDGRGVSVEIYTGSRTELTEFRTPYYQEQRKLHETKEKYRPVRPREHPPGWSE